MSDNLFLDCLTYMTQLEALMLVQFKPVSPPEIIDKMQLALLISSVVLAAIGVAAQGPLIPAIPVPGKIVSPTNGARYGYGEVIPFAYNYTEASEKLLAPPLVDVYIYKWGEEHLVEVAKNLDCRNSQCINGILKLDLSLRQYAPLIGWGTYELVTIQENFSPFLINASRIVTKTITGLVGFTIELPFGGPVTETPGMHGLTVQ
ncbi:hypothetical protein CALVIDRAFT_220863 [Calocera viscosa TUFC12733]|uniref:Uncharacterized protein n=1 Tax=Calocera viscosa (strain TUFC12733) TaxID=1330018 RepID=A0A167RKT0_CALVF|nr:hypothetical protein CALVIDRAFT_220863 [Calocera viscosa TUFC12733]